MITDVYIAKQFPSFQKAIAGVTRAIQLGYRYVDYCYIDKPYNIKFSTTIENCKTSASVLGYASLMFYKPRWWKLVWADDQFCNYAQKLWHKTLAEFSTIMPSEYAKLLCNTLYANHTERLSSFYTLTRTVENPNLAKKLDKMSSYVYLNSSIATLQDALYYLYAVKDLIQTVNNWR